MKKLATLFAFSALGLFAIGCNEAGDDAPEPVPADVSSGGDMPSPEGSSSTVDEGGAVNETPPVTEEAPPTLTPSPEASDTGATPAEAAPEGDAATAAPEATDPAEPAPANEESNPQ